MGPAPIPTLHNIDGEEVMFHRVRFPFARGVTQALVGERLDTVPALQRETTHFWNWLGEKPNGKAKSTVRMAWGVTMADGTPVLGNVELKGRALMLAVTSAERAKRGTALIKDQSAPSCDFCQRGQRIGNVVSGIDRKSGVKGRRVSLIGVIGGGQIK